MFEDALVRQIRFALRSAEGTFRVHKCQGRIYVDCDGYYDYEETVEALKKCVWHCRHLPGRTDRGEGI